MGQGGEIWGYLRNPGQIWAPNLPWALVALARWAPLIIVREKLLSRLIRLIFVLFVRTPIQLDSNKIILFLVFQESFFVVRKFIPNS